MKIIIMIIFCFALSMHVIAQRIDSIPQLNKEDFLLKSKRQKTTGYILLGSGILITGLGFATSFSEAFPNIFVPEQERSNSGNAISILGLLTIGSSIPFFIASSSSKKKAINVAIKNEKANLITQNGFSQTLIPSIQLKIRL